MDPVEHPRAGSDRRRFLGLMAWPAGGAPLHLVANDDSFSITGARVLGSGAPVTWKASGDGFDITPSGPATNPVATVLELTVRLPEGVGGNGTGLAGRYWTNPDFSGTPALTRTDRTLNFAWRAKGSPAAGIPADNFSARWTGFVQPQFTGTHTFQTISDETVRVWVDGRLVIDSSTPHGPRLDKGTISLQAGRRYSIRVDYTERTGEAYLKLQWSNPNRRQRIIQTSQLYPS
jgi:alpha-L-fucosidase